MTETENPRVVPAPVERFLTTAYPQGAPDLRSLVMNGEARMRPAGPLWLRAHARFALLLGQARVVDFAVHLGPLVYLRGRDSYIAGRGRTRIGRTTTTGPGVDQGSYLALVAECLPYPSAWPHLSDLAWHAVDDDHVTLTTTCQGEAQRIEVTFDPATAMPVQFDVDRCRGPELATTPWRARSSDWTVRHGIPVPGLITARWLDHPEPWFRMTVTAAEADADIGPDLAAARLAEQLADAQEEPS